MSYALNVYAFNLNKVTAILQLFNKILRIKVCQVNFYIHIYPCHSDTPFSSART